MKLEDYFKIHKIKPTPWGLKNDIYPALLSRYLNGKGISPTNAEKIEKATRGEVTRLELLYPTTEINSAGSGHDVPDKEINHNQ